jgi:hypothetical protein
MSPQFVDFDADGDLDLVAGTFDGSPHLARRAANGWQQPEQILDAEGVRISLHQFWDHDTKKWSKTTRGDVPGEPPAAGHATSAIAFDDDGDGDLDLLLGDHKSGHVYRRENRGTAAAPKFALGNQRVLGGDAPIDVPGTVATLRLVDFDRDGRVDLLLSSMGDAYSDKAGGGVFWCRNVGDSKQARFGPLQTLVPVSTKGKEAANRPDSGLYAEAGDADGDGDLDLFVGGYSHWQQKGKVLSEAQQQRVQAIHAATAELQQELQRLTAEAQKASAGIADEAEAGKRYTEAYKAQKKERDQNRERMQKLTEELGTLVPAAQRRSFVWFYENTTPRPQ